MISKENKKELNGLVLAGGKSVRMGEDKGLIKWHQQEQRYHMAELLRPFCHDVFISCRPDQAKEINKKYKIIEDTYEEGGPLGAIASAFHQNKNHAWLVIACDLPLISSKTIGYLIQHRDLSVMATAFQSPHDGLPEPLIAIWEPQTLSLLESALSERKTCPRKVLLNTTIRMLKPQDPSALINVNTREEKEKVEKILQRKTTVI